MWDTSSEWVMWDTICYYSWWWWMDDCLMMWSGWWWRDDAFLVNYEWMMAVVMELALMVVEYEFGGGKDEHGWMMEEKEARNPLPLLVCDLCCGGLSDWLWM